MNALAELLGFVRFYWRYRSHRRRGYPPSTAARLAAGMEPFVSPER